MYVFLDDNYGVKTRFLALILLLVMSTTPYDPSSRINNPDALFCNVAFERLQQLPPQYPKDLAVAVASPLTK